MLNFLLLGGTLFGARAAFGDALNRNCINYLGQRKGEWASIAVYFFGFFFLMNRVNKIERNDINYLINARELSGEVFLNTCLHLYPAKVNLELYRNLMLEKQ